MDRFTGKLLLPWLRFSLRPDDVAAQLAARSGPVCYVLERDSPIDEMVVQRACARAGLPRPAKRLLPGRLSADNRSLLPLARTVGLWRERLDRRPPPLLRELLRELARDPAFDVTLVPVAVYWGRAPQREGTSLLRLALSEEWALSSRLKRFLTVLFNGRNTLVEFGDGVSLRSLLGGDAPTGNRAARRIARQLMAQLDAARAAYIGPDLSHRRTLMTQVLRTRAVRSAVAQQVRERGIPRRKALDEARVLFEEIAADYSPVFVTLMERVLKRLWTRIFDGVEVAHGQTLAQIATGNEVVYVPSHRSTMDDLLMPYAIYTQGFAVPHIAAGINLDLPLVGPLLRKGGAFFLRRSFRGNALYTVVFMNYLGTMMARGHPLQYFVEGGRSRTGRLLPPKTGMLSMTVRSYLRQPLRPVVFVPVYLGYERIIEVGSYVSELSGQPKQKETLLGFLRSLKRLRENFGRVHVNIGEPIPLLRMLDAADPDWRERVVDGEGKGGFVATAVDATAAAIMRNVNAAAAVTPVSLLALVLLATPKQVLLEADLLRQLALCRQLLELAPYSARVTISPLSPEEMVARGETLQVVARHADGTIGLLPAAAPLQVYYRNNVLHLFAMPSLIACCFLSNASMRTPDIQRLAWRIYPYIAAELFLRWNEDEVEAVVIAQLEALVTAGVLERADDDRWRTPPPNSARAMQLSLLAQPTLQTVERYYLAIALLKQAGSGVLTQSELEQRCQQRAKQMGTLYGFHSPEFFDRSLFQGFISLMRRRGVVRADGDGRLVFDEVLDRIVDDAQLVLSGVLRHSVLQVAHG